MNTRICETCNETIPRNPNWGHSYYQTRRFCDRACQRASRPSIASDYDVTAEGCWEWKGRLDRNGYGKAYDPTRPPGARVDWAHRVSYRRHHGEIPGGHDLDHLCENPPCINPDHLEPVTRAEHAARTMRRLGKDRLHEQAAQLRGLGLTYAEIAQTVGLLGAGSAHAAALAAIRKGLVDESAVPRISHLTDDDRAGIRALWTLGVPQTEIAAWFCIDSSQVSRVCSGKRSGRAA